MLVLKEPFKTAWANKDPFEEVLKLNGEIYREVATRRTLNFKFQGESFYIKVHRGTTVKEILKNYLSLRAPVLGAANEYRAINRLTELGVNTMEVVAFGERGVNPLTRESFIITKDLNPAISLEDYCKNWKDNPPPYHVKKVLIEEIARMVKTMHEGGVNHRDCYICHFLLKKKIRTNFLPKYFGSFECGELIGFEQECFLNETSGGMCKSATTLKNYILDINVSDEDISRHLNALKCEMLKSCIECGDLHGENILAINEEGKWRLVIIDGFGVPEFVPLPMYFKWFRKRKILRQWEKLERRLKAIFTERLELLKK